MVKDTQEFERYRPLGADIVADFVKRGKRPRQGSFTVPKNLTGTVVGLTPGKSYILGLEADDDGPCGMRLVSVEAA